MAGRFQNTGRGSGGRGAGRSNSQPGRGNGAYNNKTNGKNGTKEKKFHPLTRGKAPEYSFEDVKKTLIVKMSTMKMDHIDDMITSVKDMELFDIGAEEPSLELLAEGDNADFERINEERRLTYSSDRKDYRARKLAFENNKRYVYGIIMKMCTEFMTDKLEREHDFETTLFNNPVELLLRIRKFMTITADTEWEFFGLWEAMTKLFNCRQKENESIANYRKRYEEAADAVEMLTGSQLLEVFLEKTQGYGYLRNDGERIDYKERGWEQFKANGFIYNSDRAKYQSRIDSMVGQYTLKHLTFSQRCIFPTTLENAVDVLNVHKHDNRKKRTNNNGNHQTRKNDGDKNKTINNNDRGSQLSQQERACYCCGGKDHVAPGCEHKMRPRDQWVRPDKYVDYSVNRRNRQNIQQENSESNNGGEVSHPTQWSYGSSNGSSNDSSGTQLIQRGGDRNEHQGVMLFQGNRSPVHLDSGSTFHLRKSEEDMIEGTIRDIPGGFHYDSNVNGRDLSQEGLDEIWRSMSKLDRNASDNINSLSTMVRDRYHVFFDSERHNSFFVMKNGQIWRFGHNNGLYTLVDEPEMLTCQLYNQARGIDDDGRDPRMKEVIRDLRGMANVLQRDRRRRGTRMNEFYQLWRWTKYLQWVYELAWTRRMRMEDINEDDVVEEFRLRAIAEGTTRDSHEWADGNSFDFNVDPNINQGEHVNNDGGANVVPNVLDEEFEGYCALQSVEKNKEGYTKRQVSRANMARSIYHMMGAPDPRVFQLALRGNFFKNCPITEEDFIISNKIYGRSVSTLKGKQKRQVAKAHVNDWVEIPKELLQHNSVLDLCIDIMFINNVALFVSIDKAIKFRFCTDLPDRTKDAIYKAIDEILRIYNHADFRIRTILCDNEFRPVFDDVKDEMDVNMDYAPPGQHEPTIERSNQTLKALFRTHYHRMVYKAIPKVLTIALIKHVTKVMNFYPAKEGISEHYSPHTIVNRRPVDMKKECVAEIGSYVQAHGHATSNNQSTRTIDGIYLGPSDNVQGGHEIMDLNTRQKITRPHITVLPITKQVIKLVEDMAHDEGVRDLRTYHWKNGEIILDGDLLAGVDPDDLWDETYIPQDKEYKRGDDNLRSERIDQEEIDDLLADAENFLENSSDDDNDVINEEEHQENRSVASIYERLERRERREESDQNPNPNEEEETDEELNRKIEQIENEISQIAGEIEQLNEETEEKEELSEEEEEEKDHNHEQDADIFGKIEEQIAECEAQIDDVQEFIGTLDSNNESNNEYDDESHDSDHEIDENENNDDEKTSREENPSPKRTRSGTSYRQNGTKMRPTDRNNRERPRYNQQYMKREKDKRLWRNKRCELRKKAKLRRLKPKLKRLLALKELARQKRGPIESKYNLAFQQIGKDRKVDYGADKAMIIANFMEQIKDKVRNEGKSFIQQYYLNKGLKIFKDEGEKAAMAELDQLVERNCWEPVHVENMTELEKSRAQDAMMLLAEKNNGDIKGRCVYKGNGTREWLTREDTSSPTASLEGIIITCVIDAYEHRDMMSLDIPNAFIQTMMPEDPTSRVMMKITGLLVDMLIRLNPMYRDYVVMENGKRVIYVRVLRAIYGMLEASMLWYKKLRSDLEENGFIFNAYDACIANKMVNGKQQTIRFHVDDLLSSHVDPRVNDDFFDWMNKKYGSIKPVKATRGKVHEYLGMTLDFRKKGKVKIRMDEYLKRMLKAFPIKFDGKKGPSTPAGIDLLSIGKGEKLNDEMREIFHTFVAKGLFLSKRARLDIAPTISVLSTRVQSPNEADWKKLVRLMMYLHGTQGMHLTLSANDLRTIKWYVDASFAVHPDFRSHTGGVMTMGEGGMQILSKKQKLNSRSSTEAELIGVDDSATQILWTKLFVEAQGYPVEDNLLYQDNKSSILLETNGRDSAGKRSRALNIRYFFITDQVKKGNVRIEYCPTDDMWGDFMSKPLQGQKFIDFRTKIQGEQD